VTKQDVAKAQWDIAEILKETQQNVEFVRKETQDKLVELNISLVTEITAAKVEKIKWVKGVFVAQGAGAASL
jgi:hypothetical protein